jgi:hypothetical protein
LPHIDGSLEEAAYALDQLHLDGVGLYSSTDGIYLGDGHYDPLLEELNRRQSVVFIHPTGLKRVEATSFVHPRHVPQMADAEEVMARLSRAPGVRYEALVPNVNGAERGIAASVGGRSYVVCQAAAARGTGAW